MALAFATRATVATSATLAANANRFMLPPWMWNPREAARPALSTAAAFTLADGISENAVRRLGYQPTCAPVTARKRPQTTARTLFCRIAYDRHRGALGLGRRTQRVDLRNPLAGPKLRFCVRSGGERNYCSG